MIKLLIFDMDGTIIDSDQVLIKTREELYSLYKKDVTFDPNKIAEYSGPPLSYALNDAFKGYDNLEFIRTEYRKRTKKYYDTDLNLFKNTKKALNLFYKNGIRLAVLTAKNLEMTTYCLKKFHLFSYFNDLITCDSNFKPKPSSEGIDFLLNKYHLKSDEVMMVGDTYYDAMAAVNAGVRSCVFTMRYRIRINEVSKYLTLKASSYDELIDFIKKENNLK